MPIKKVFGTEVKDSGKQAQLATDQYFTECDCDTCEDFWAQFDIAWQEYSCYENRKERNKKCRLTSHIVDDYTASEGMDTEEDTGERGSKLQRTDTHIVDPTDYPRHVDSGRSTARISASRKN